jgi:hypothetical protein
MEPITGRSPEQIRDDIAQMLLDEFLTELLQLGVSMEELLEMDHYQIDTFRKKVWKQWRKNELKKEERLRHKYTLGGRLIER